MSSSAETGILGTLTNGLQVLEFLASGKAGIREISEEVGLARQSTYRVLRTLCAAGWVERDTNDEYSLTARVWSIGMRYFSFDDVRNRLSDVIQKLAADHGESVHLAMYESGTVVYIDKADGWQPIRAYTEVGGIAPAYCVATGKILLALQSQTQQQLVIAQGLTKHTDHTIIDPDALRAELQLTAERGYAVNRGEWREEAAGVAIPIITPPVGASLGIGFSGPTARILAQVEPLVAALRSAVEDSGIATIAAHPQSEDDQA